MLNKMMRGGLNGGEEWRIKEKKKEKKNQGVKTIEGLGGHVTMVKRGYEANEAERRGF